MKDFRQITFETLFETLIYSENILSLILLSPFGPPVTINASLIFFPKIKLSIRAIIIKFSDIVDTYYLILRKFQTGLDSIEILTQSIQNRAFQKKIFK